MDYAKAEAFRAAVAAGMTTAEAVQRRYVERSLDAAESTHRAQPIVPEGAPSDGELLAALQDRAENGSLPAHKVPSRA